MARERNFLLGNGERLTKQVEVPKGGGDKNPPYAFAEARMRSSDQARLVARKVADLDVEACPGNEAVLAITMHPRYVAKSDFPSQLFNTLGLRAVGTKSVRVSPDNWGIERHPDKASTDQIFVAGSRDRLERLDRFIGSMDETTRGARDLSHVENIEFVSPIEKLKRSVRPAVKDGEILEAVLHNTTRVDVLTAFVGYASALEARVDVDRSRTVGGLTFVPVISRVENTERLANFAFCRVLRSMPTIRPVPVSVLRLGNARIILPTDSCITDSERALIFDGGIPKNARSDLGQWVTLVEPPSIGPALTDFEAHGLAVTSAFLFGPVTTTATPNRPICPVDHVRVLDDAVSGTDPYYYDVLDRMLKHFDAEGHRYGLINMSLGPNLPIEDDDVTVWTAEWDHRLAKGNWIVTVAAGNDGELDASSGNNRIQPPSDGVNLLTIGACDKSNGDYLRAVYSCIGPGRRPGFRKPDGLVFGGSDSEPFGFLSDGSRLGAGQGTSLASPYALRQASAVKAQLGSSIGSLAIRALMIHRASNLHDIPPAEIGWGRFETDPSLSITCDDHEVMVVYQGELTSAEYLRAAIPLPVNSTKGMVEIEATLVVSSEVDPAHAAAYTRRGVEVFFRPHDEKYAEAVDGKRPEHPKTAAFLSAAELYGKSETMLRENGFKWEPCRRGSVRMRSASLKSPCFDIYHHYRANGVASSATTNTKYALVVTIRSKQTRDLYDKVVRAYSNILIPLRPQVQIKIVGQ